MRYTRGADMDTHRCQDQNCDCGRLGSISDNSSKCVCLGPRRELLLLAVLRDSTHAVLFFLQSAIRAPKLTSCDVPLPLVQSSLRQSQASLPLEADSGRD